MIMSPYPLIPHCASQESLVLYLSIQIQLGTIGSGVGERDGDAEVAVGDINTAGGGVSFLPAGPSGRGVSPGPETMAFSTDALHDLVVRDIEMENIKW